MLFYPTHTAVPESLVTEHFYLRPLQATDAALDFAALMESRTVLRAWSQSAWPADDFTVAENAVELAKHAEEHQQGIAFTFTVLDLQESRCLGCVYINPLMYPLNTLSQHKLFCSDVQDYQAGVTFWVRASCLEMDLDRSLLTALIAWFKQAWSFTSVFFWTPADHLRQLRIFEMAGLMKRLEASAPEARYCWYGYGK